MKKLPPNARLIALGMFLGGSLGVAMCFLVDPARSGLRLFLLFVGPMLALLGLGGVIEPKIAFSIGKYGSHLPLVYKLVGGALAIAGLGVSAFLAFVVFKVHRV